MRRVGVFWAVAGLTMAAMARGGVNVWTTNGPGVVAYGAVTDAVTGAVYTGATGRPYRSDDHGATWAAACALPGYLTVPLAARGGTVFAVTSDGWLYQSPDSGQSCSLVTDPPGDNGYIIVIDSDGATVYRCQQTAYPRISLDIRSAFWRSADGGTTWSSQGLGEGLPFSDSHATAMAADPSALGVLYIATTAIAQNAGSPLPALYRTADSGTSWSVLGTLPASVATLAVDPFSSSTLYVGSATSGSAGIWKSTDGGQTFARFNDSLTVQIVPDLVTKNRIFVATADQGVLRSDDGGISWTPMNAGLTPNQLSIAALALEPATGFLHANAAGNAFDIAVTNPGELILNTSHPFTITLSATDPHTSQTAPGVAMRGNDLWGYFSIPAITNNPGNPEVFVKLLDGTAINGSFWFFYGGLTNLEYTLTVTDSTNGATKTYTKPAGSECGGSDTAAFTP